MNGETDPSYWDWKLGVSKTWESGWNLGLFYVQGSNNFWENTQSLSTTSPDTKDLNKGDRVLCSLAARSDQRRDAARAARK